MSARISDFRAPLPRTLYEDLPVMLDYMGRYGCLPRDALHLAVMRRFAMDGIVTTDRDFVSVDGLDLFTCNPQILQQQ